jgi:DNA replication and repair protein RecF
LPAAELSTGEQKTLLLSIVLAAARLQAATRGFAPLLLLDEVTAHLDSVHRNGLFTEIAALGAQAWLTGTDPGLFTPLAQDACFFTLVDGRIDNLT